MNAEFYYCGETFEYPFELLIRQPGFTDVWRINEIGEYYAAGQSAEDWRPEFSRPCNRVPVNIAYALGAIVQENYPPESCADDVQALNEIGNILDGQEWSAATLEEVAAIVQATGREIKEPWEVAL